MANYSGALSVHQTLGANTEDIVSLSDSWANVEIYNRDTTNYIYATVDNYPTYGSQVDPVVGGNDTLIIGPGASLTVPTDDGASTVATTVRLISVGACAYSVTSVR